MQTNAFHEFVSFVGTKPIKCATVAYHVWVAPEDGKELHLPVGHTEEQLSQFLTDLNFTYDGGYGGQELFGTIWFEDGTWATRGEYDGSEWWELHQCPEIPDHLVTRQQLPKHIEDIF